MNSAQHPSGPAPGSHRYFAMLYTPVALREELSTLLALTDEIGTNPTIDADHSVAHARLQWWRQEVDRFARGAPEHPWLRSLLSGHPRATALDLHPLVEGAATDLATRTLSRGESEALSSALFTVAARLLLAAELEPSLQTGVSELGAIVQRLERDPADTTARSDALEALQAIGDEPQRSLTPLLVWLALAASGRPRRGRLRATLSDNFVAWSAARRAARGRFHLS